MAKRQHHHKPVRILASDDKVRDWLKSVQNKNNLQQFLLFSAPDGMVQPGAMASASDIQDAATDEGYCLLAGSFAPVHEGHLEMARIAVQSYSLNSCWFEICISNVDKAELQFEHLVKRLRQDFHANGLLVSNAPTFDAKAELFPGATFAVGADTLQRICQLKYYQNSESEFERAIDRIASKQCRFLVFGRTIEGDFVDESSLQLPDNLHRLCQFVSKEKFKRDVSSTEIRGRDQH